jgi:hypothetical protein
MEKHDEETLNHLVRDLNLDQKTKDKAAELFLEFKSLRPEIVSLLTSDSRPNPSMSVLRNPHFI